MYFSIVQYLLFKVMILTPEEMLNSVNGVQFREGRNVLCFMKIQKQRKVFKGPFLEDFDFDRFYCICNFFTFYFQYELIFSPELYGNVIHRHKHFFH